DSHLPFALLHREQGEPDDRLVIGIHFGLTGEIRPVRNSDMVSKAFFPKKPMRRFSSSNAPACT
ncbi:MAG: hypothetical protein KDD27_14140, partial [Saprospiraceae bacterium]|nr:hypothetical protein [Saprospiraceae bacterium]